MVLKRPLENWSNESAKRLIIDSKEPELMDLTEEDQDIELDQKMESVVAELLKSHPYPIHQALLKLKIPEITLIVRRLLKKGISPDLQDKYGDTALHLAVMGDGVDYQVIVELLNHGANTEIRNIDREIPLSLAIENYKNESEKVKIIKKLLKHGANPNVHGRNGDTSLHKSCLNGNISITKILLEYGANVNLLNDNKEAPLHMTFLGAQNQREDVELVIKELLKHGADVNLQNNYGGTILHDAASEENIPESLFQELFKHGADPNVKDLSGETPLHMAVHFEQKTNVKNLLKYVADPNIRHKNGYSSFETALTCEQKGIFRMLVFNHQSQ